MYRKASGGTGFSFGRLMTNTVPNFANDNPEQDADLSMNEKDILWIHQVQGAEAANRSPMTLDTGSALKAGITPHEKVSAKIHKKLVQNGVVNPDSPLGIDTTKVTPKFAHQLSFISVGAQRKVVGMLFFWEEEAIRWRLLEQEQAELETAMAAEGATEEVKKELKIRLESVQMRKGMRPSQRPALQGEGEDPGAQQPEVVAPPQYA